LENFIKINSLIEAFDIKPCEVISLVGAGGKTNLMFSLARELSNDSGIVITTTTTKMFKPLPSEDILLFLSEDRHELVCFINECKSKFVNVTLASKKIENTRKLKGLNPEIIPKLSNIKKVGYTIIEADGAARKPLKAPDTSIEPVIPRNTTLVIPVVGIDALGKPLSEENVFRADIAAELSGDSLGDPVTEDTIVSLMVHPLGMTYGSPDSSRIIPFINKVDLDGGLIKARSLSSKLIMANHPRIDRVVLGQSRIYPPVKEMVMRGVAF
jgi:probable selenium-dependent hydroxylase accessory protein YqeC